VLRLRLNHQLNIRRLVIVFLILYCSKPNLYFYKFNLYYIIYNTNVYLYELKKHVIHMHKSLGVLTHKIKNKKEENFILNRLSWRDGRCVQDQFYFSP